MGFWKNVEKEINFSGSITRKTIAYETGLNIQTINRAIERDSRVYVEDALKVAMVFGKPVTYFLDTKIELNNSTKKDPNSETKNQLYLYSKHQQLIADCESLSENGIRAVNLLANTLAQKNPDYN